jgi:hypothetical protein
VIILDVELRRSTDSWGARHIKMDSMMESSVFQGKVANVINEYCIHNDCTLKFE